VIIVNIKKLPTLLIIDANGLDLWLPGLLLRPYGFTVHETTTTWNAIAHIIEYDIDIVFINIWYKYAGFVELVDFIKTQKLRKTPLLASYAPAGTRWNIQEDILVRGVSTPIHRAEELLSWMLERFPDLAHQIPRCRENIGRGRKYKK